MAGVLAMVVVLGEALSRLQSNIPCLRRFKEVVHWIVTSQQVLSAKFGTNNIWLGLTTKSRIVKEPQIIKSSVGHTVHTSA